MARDADGNYRYDAGTISGEMDSWTVYEDEDGNVGFYNGTGEVRLHELAFVVGDQRGPPDSDELEDGEYMMYVSDGSSATAGKLVLASSDGSTVSLEEVSSTAV